MNKFKNAEAIKITPTKSLIKALVISMGLTFIVFAIFSLIISFHQSARPQLTQW